MKSLTKQGYGELRGDQFNTLLLYSLAKSKKQANLAVELKSKGKIVFTKANFLHKS